MMVPTDPLELSVLLYREMQQCQFVEGGALSIQGILPEDFDFQQICQVLENRNILESSEPSTRTIRLTVSKSFFKTLDALLLNPTRRIKQPERFYIADLDYLHPHAGIEPPACVQQYMESVRLYNALKNVADHVNDSGSSGTLVFLGDRKLELSASYSPRDLASLSKLNAFEADFINTEMHAKQKKTIIRTVLFDIFANATAISMADIIKCFDHIVAQANASYQLYVSEFSFQKVKSEIEKEKLEFITKLNKVFSDIQNQLIAVPAALILIGGQMQNTGTPSIRNALIWCGAFVFAFFMDLLIRNQRNTLAAIKNEIDHQWRIIRDKHQAVSGIFEDSYAVLQNRHNEQRRLLRSVDCLVALALLAASGLFLWYSMVDVMAIIQSGLWSVLLGFPAYCIYRLYAWIKLA